jgi:hypothetical protein
VDFVFLLALSKLTGVALCSKCWGGSGVRHILIFPKCTLIHNSGGAGAMQSFGVWWCCPLGYGACGLPLKHTF